MSDNSPIDFPQQAFWFSAAVVSNSFTMPSAQLDSAFQEMAGVDLRLDMEEIAEGGLSRYVHQLSKTKRHANLVLRRGYVTEASTLAAWAALTVTSTLEVPVERKTVNVWLLGPDGQRGRSLTPGR